MIMKDSDPPPSSTAYATASTTSGVSPALIAATVACIALLLALVLLIVRSAASAQVARATSLIVVIAIIATLSTSALLAIWYRIVKRSVDARAQAEHALRRNEQEMNVQVEQRTAQLTELSQHLIRVAEEEKAEIARELHGTLGSNLTAINMDLNWIAKRLPERPELRDRLQRALQMLTATVEMKHQLIEGLRPSHLDNLGLGFAMRTHCRDFSERSGTPCEVKVEEDFDDLDPRWAIALYRVVQESLSNVVRHARAQTVEVQLSREHDGIRLRVLDDGDGIPADAASRTSSHGLVGMQERMRQVGGSVLFSQRLGQRGTI
ncbi:MAG: sensor histidine kinase, partial [Povalibacter sp.]